MREDIIKKLSSKRIIKNYLDPSDIKKYTQYIAKRIKSRRQELEIIKKKEHNINNTLFKYYFKYQSPSKMYNILNDLKDTENHNTLVDLIKSGLID